MAVVTHWTLVQLEVSAVVAVGASIRDLQSNIARGRGLWVVVEPNADE